jgi:hypothetical protein
MHERGSARVVPHDPAEHDRRSLASRIGARTHHIRFGSRVRTSCPAGDTRGSATGSAVPAAIRGGRGALAAFVAYFGIKAILGFVVAGAVAGAVGALFGSSWDRLPSDARGQLERRIEAAVGDGLNGLNDPLSRAS